MTAPLSYTLMGWLGQGRACEQKVILLEKLRPNGCANTALGLTNNCIRGAIMAAYHAIPVDLLRQMVSYDRRTGILTWMPRTIETNNGIGGTKLSWFNKNLAGKPAFSGSHPDGYLKGSIFRKFVTAHRVAWAIHYGEWPTGQIDHINGDPADNRICNLREVSAFENHRNRKRGKNNQSGCVGVTMPPGQYNWLAQITVRGVIHNLGRFRHFDDAVAARKAAERRFGFHPNHGR